MLISSLNVVAKRNYKKYKDTEYFRIMDSDKKYFITLNDINKRTLGMRVN